MVKSTCGRREGVGGHDVQWMIKMASLGEEVLAEIMRAVLFVVSLPVIIISAVATQCVYGVVE